MTTPRRKENSTAAAAESPTMRPPTMVTREREVPGHMAMHWMKPMVRAWSAVRDSSELPALVAALSCSGEMPCFLALNFLSQTVMRMARPPKNHAAVTG